MVDAIEDVGVEDDDALAGLGGEGGGAGGAEVGEEPTADDRGDEARRFGSDQQLALSGEIGIGAPLGGDAFTITPRASLRPAAWPIHSPSRSVMPVAARPPEITNTAATMIAGSLAKPDNACLGSSTRVSTSASRISIAVTSTRSFSVMNRYSPPARIRPNASWDHRRGGRSIVPSFCTLDVAMAHAGGR